MIVANVIALLHAIADTVSKITAESPFNCDSVFLHSVCKFRRAKFYRFFKKQPRVLRKPIFAAAADMKIVGREECLNG